MSGLAGIERFGQAQADGKGSSDLETVVIAAEEEAPEADDAPAEDTQACTTSSVCLSIPWS